MPKIWSRVLVCALGTLLASPTCWAQTVPPAESLLPATTKGAVIIRNTQELTEHWNRTQVGKLLKDPVMESFSQDLRHQFQDRWSGAREKLGLTLDDLRGVPSGEVAVGVAKPAENESAIMIVMDVTGNLQKATTLLDKVSKNLRRQGAKETQHNVGGTTVILFDLPKLPDDDRQRQAIYFLSGNLLGASDHLGVIKGILERFNGKPGPSLAEVPAFQYVMKRCQKQGGDAAPQIRWFLEPIGYIEAIRIATPAQDTKQGKTLLDVAKNQGFEGIRGVGGFVDFAVDSYEVFHHTAIFAPPPFQPAPPPYEKIVSMDMLTFPNHKDFAPLPWIPDDIATHTTFYWDVLKAFDNFGPTFDELFGEGETNVWKEVLQSLKEDPNGPQIDLREELVAQLGQRVTVITDYQLPITTKSERLLFALEARNAEKVAEGLKKMMQDDPTVKRRVFKHEGKEYIIWETIEEPLQAVPTVSLDIPSLTPGAPVTPPKEEEEEEKLLPHAAVTVAHGQMLIASHIDFLIKILQGGKPLAGAIDYHIVDDAIGKLTPPAYCVRSFSRTDEEYRPTYELIRLGKMPESETMFGRLLNAMFGAGKKGMVRKQKIDGSELPDYQVVRRHLGPAGLFVVTEEQGWYVLGFMLAK